MDEFGILNRLLPSLDPRTIESFAKDVLSLAERLITPTDVLIIMSFDQRALGKDIVTTAFEGTVLPFDIFDVPTQDTLETKLKLEIGMISERFGRRLRAA